MKPFSKSSPPRRAGKCVVVALALVLSATGCWIDQLGTPRPTPVRVATNNTSFDAAAELNARLLPEAKSHPATLAPKAAIVGGFADGALTQILRLAGRFPDAGRVVLAIVFEGSSARVRMPRGELRCSCDAQGRWHLAEFLRTEL